MNILHIVRMMFRTIFDVFYIYNHSYVFGNTTVDLVIFYFFLISIVILMLRRLVL